MHLTFLTPLGGLLAAGALVPLAALALNERQARRARRALALEAPVARSRALTLLALAVPPVLLGLALAQPVLQSTRVAHVRTDAQVFYVFDTSESMRAATGRHRPTRLERAVATARRLRNSLREIPSGVATMTDRVLPNVFPTSSEEVFANALSDTVGVNRPPPKGFNDTATTFAALDTFAGDNFFSDGIRRRLVLLFTDGETAPYFGGDLHEALRGKPPTRFVIVRLGGSGERIYTGGKADRGYRPDPAAARETRSLASVLGGRSYTERDVGSVLSAARLFLGRGPIADVGQGLHVIALARWITLAALLPVLGLLWRRNIA
ncbi:MAG: VWA domain-containing protein [Thermoleophilia bacterium]|nr:VWA domain-containing protein [Thermoleophilia bacterium]